MLNGFLNILGYQAFFSCHTIGIMASNLNPFVQSSLNNRFCEWHNGVFQAKKQWPIFNGILHGWKICSKALLHDLKGFN